MRKIAIILAGLVLLSGMAGAASVSSTSFTGVDDGNEISDSVEESNGTVTVLNGTVDTLRVNQSFEVADNDSNVTVEISVSKDVAESLEGSDSIEGDREIRRETLDNGTTLEYDVSLWDGENSSKSLNSSETYEDALVVTVTYDNESESNVTSTQSYNLEVEEGGGFEGASIGDVPDIVPSFLSDMGTLGLFIFYTLAVGVIVLGAVALYLLYHREDLGQPARATGYAAVSLGSLGSVGIQSGVLIVAAFLVLLAAVIYLYRSGGDSPTTTDGTMYIE